MVGNIDYNEFFGKEENNKKSIYSHLNLTDKKGEILAKNSFMPIKRRILKSFDGNGCMIDNLFIGDNSDYIGGTENDGRYNSGLFRYIDTPFEVKNLIFNNANVTSQKNCAVLIAEAHCNKVKVSGILIKNSQVNATKKDGNAAALIGYGRCDNGLFVDNCGATIMATAQYGRAAGLIGGIGNKAIVNNCYSSGYQDNDGYGDTYDIKGTNYIGGFIGRLSDNSDASFTNCYSTCSVLGKNDTKDSNNNYQDCFVGGFVGGDESGQVSKYTFDNCYFAGKVARENGEYGKNVVIGIFGGRILPSTNTNNVKYINCYYLKGINLSSYSALGNNATSNGLEAKEYSDMETSSETRVSQETYPNSITLRNSDYPFEMVTGLGKTNTSTSGVHYGNWPTTSNIIVTYKKTSISSGNTISSEADLRKIENNLSGNYVQKCDITLSEGFKPLGNGKTFTGTYDGGGYKIIGLTQTSSSSSRVGLFYDLGKGSIVKNINLEAVKIKVQSDSEGDCIGTLCEKTDGKLEKIKCNGNIEYSGNKTINSIGGIVGKALGASEIKDCHYKGNIVVTQGAAKNVGGLVGSTYGKIRSSSFSGKQEILKRDQQDENDSSNYEQQYVGGLAGYIGKYSIISQSYSKPSITAQSNCIVGGLLGYVSSLGTVNNSYAIPYFASKNANDNNISLLFGKREFSREELSDNIHFCHGVEVKLEEVDKEKIFHVIPTLLPFASGEPIQGDNNYCYFYGENDNAGAIAINSIDKYSLLESFGGFDSKIWNVSKNAKYPTLVNNKE